MNVVTLKEYIITTLQLDDLDQPRKDKIAQDLVMLATEQTFDDLLENVSSTDLDNLQKYADIQPDAIPAMFQETDKHLQQFSLIFNKHLHEILRKSIAAADAGAA